MIPEKYRMKWYGWGRESVRYSLNENPGIAEYLKIKFGIDRLKPKPAFSLAEVKIAPSRVGDSLLQEFRSALGASNCSTQHAERIYHSCGQSYKDICRLRSGTIENAPDVVFYPENEEHIRTIFKLAAKHRIALIPFGGGTSVVGGVEPGKNGFDFSATVNTTSLNKILQIDPVSLTATAQAGIFGPELEAGLNREGFTLGHFPQSFEFSTLGGWIAPRSSGQNSVLYGGIEKLLVAVKMMGPAGEIDTVICPRHAEGPDLKDLITGSEGFFGIIVSATVRIRPMPRENYYFMYAMENFEQAATAARKVIQSGIKPAMLRVSDEDETEAFVTMGKTKNKSIADYLKKSAAKFWLETRGLRPSKIASILIGLEGSEAENRQNRRRIAALFREYNCAYLGTSPGKKWLKERFHLPYLRDELLDNELLIDTLETSTEWSNLMNLYEKVKAAIASVSEKENFPIVVLTHISHLYPDGASLYFTFITPQRKPDLIGQWEEIKLAANDAIREMGGAISHHHGVGLYHKNHLPWTDTQRKVVKQIKAALDPEGFMNPGKLL